MKLVYMLTQTIFNIFLFLGRIWKQSVKELSKCKTFNNRNNERFELLFCFAIFVGQTWKQENRKFCAWKYIKRNHLKTFEITWIIFGVSNELTLTFTTVATPATWLLPGLLVFSSRLSRSRSNDSIAIVSARWDPSKRSFISCRYGQRCMWFQQTMINLWPPVSRNQFCL